MQTYERTVVAIPNCENLRGHQFTSDQSREEAAKNGRKGGIASGKARRAKKSMRELAQAMMDSPASGGFAKAAKQMGADLDTDDMTNAAAILAGQMLAAFKGNTNAARFIAELMDDAARTDAVEQDGLSKSLEELGKSL